MASGDVVASVFRGGQRRVGGGEASLCVWRKDENQEGRRVAELWFLVVGGARSSEGGGIIKKIRHVFMCFSKWYGPQAGPFWPAGLTGRTVMGWRAEILGLAHTFSVGLTDRSIGSGPFCHSYLKANI